MGETVPKPGWPILDARVELSGDTGTVGYSVPQALFEQRQAVSEPTLV